MTYNSKKLYNASELFIIVFSISILISVSVACNLLYFFWFQKTLLGYNLIFSLAAFFYPLKFALLDLINKLTTYRFAIIVAIIITITDGIFSSIPMLSHVFPNYRYVAEDSLSNISNAVYILSPHIFKLYYSGILSSLITLFFELYLFNQIIKRIKNLPISIIISTALTLLAHNLILDYSVLREYANCWNIIIGNYIVNLIVVTGYALVVCFITKRVIKI